MDVTGSHLLQPPTNAQWLPPPVTLVGSYGELDGTAPKPSRSPTLRPRPSDMLDNAEAPSPLNIARPPDRLRRPSKMSLFSLFSRNKAEKPSDSPDHISPQPWTKATKGHDSQIVEQVPAEIQRSRPASIASGKSAGNKTPKLRPRTPVAPPRPSPPPKERRSGHFEHPPLFQAYPQATKEGILEVSSMSIETLNKAKGKSNGAPGTLADPSASDHGSTEARRISALRQSANGSPPAGELPKKVFVLVTSGYLLQYAETGSSERLPEKVLPLGKDSAAFACDIVSGRHYVLQISQSVDEHGMIATNPSSIFAKLGMRSSAAKRMTSNFLVALPNAAEMESWMVAIRQQIEYQGGPKAPLKGSRQTLQSAEATTLSLTRTPSHRYQIKRNPSKVTPASSPAADRTTFLPLSTNVEEDKAESATLDGIEKEVDELNEHAASPAEASSPFPLDLPIPLTAPANVTEQAEASLGSHSNTSPQPDLIPLHDSLSPAAEPRLSTIDTSKREIFVAELPGSPGIEFASHKTGRKAPPAPLILEPQKAPLLEASRAADPGLPRSAPETGASLPAAAVSVGEDTTLSELSGHQIKRDSKLPNPLSPPDLKIVGSDNADAGSMPSMPLKLSSSPPIPPGNNRSRPTSMINGETGKARRVGSFSMPLRVNPTAIQGPVIPGNPRRHSRMDDPGSRLSEVLVGLALTPPDHAESTPLSYFDAMGSKSPPKPPSGPPAKRLSLFPSPTTSFPPAPTPSPVMTEFPQHTSSVNARHSFMQQTALNGGSLKRPTSMQVGSLQPPFLSSVRTSALPHDSRAARSTVPIRSMKPSRSSNSSDSIPSRKASPLDETISEEDKDLLLPLPNELSMPPPSKSSSRNSYRKSTRPRSSLSTLDLAVAALGPPAPPPQAPLPAPPSFSHAAGPVHVREDDRTLMQGAGLGISVP